MHIRKIEIKNFIGISELETELGKVNLVKGDSGAGKTSLVEALEKNLSNESRRTEIVRHGEEEATIFVELTDGLQIDRRIRLETSDYLKVKHETKGVKSTETFLRKLINGEIFRPIEFLKKKVEVQTQILLNMLQIEWTVEEIKTWFGEIPKVDYDKHILRILSEIETYYYEERKSINRKINLEKLNIEGIKESLPTNYDGAKWQEVKLQDLYNKVKEGEDNNKKLEEAQKLIGGLKNKLEDIAARAKTDREAKALEYNRQRDALNNRIKSTNDNIAEQQKIVDSVDAKLQQKKIDLNEELEREIEKLKLQYQTKLNIATENIKAEAETAKTSINEYKTSLAGHENTLLNIDQLEEKDLKNINDGEEAKLKAAEQETGDAQKTIDTLEVMDLEPLQEEADTAEKMKGHIQEWSRMQNSIKNVLAPLEQQSAELTAKIEKARSLPAELLKTAALPVEGLTVDSKGQIRINGTLLDGLSEGEAWDFAFRLAKAQAGELKVICIDGWQKLGSKKDKILEEAKEDDYQYILLETTENGEELTISEI